MGPGRCSVLIFVRLKDLYIWTQFSNCHLWKMGHNSLFMHKLPHGISHVTSHFSLQHRCAQAWWPYCVTQTKCMLEEYLWKTIFRVMTQKCMISCMWIRNAISNILFSKQIWEAGQQQIEIQTYSDGRKNMCTLTARRWFKNQISTWINTEISHVLHWYLPIYKIIIQSVLLKLKPNQAMLNWQ